MKKVLVFLVAMLVVFTTVQAQKGSGGGIQFGIKLGPQFSNWGGDDAEDLFGDVDKKMKVGIHGGVFALIPISSSLYFQPELLYSGQGVVFEEGNNKAKISTNHLNLPLLLRWQSEGGFYVVFGPQLGFQLNGKVKYEGDDEGEEDLDDDLRGMIFSGAVGVGYKMSNGFGVYARFAKAFSKTFDIEDVEDGDQPKIYSSTISLSFFYLFGGSKGGE